MDQYCVVVCGLQAGASDDASAWLPVAAALKLDQADFAQRVVAALPRIVRRDLDRPTAERIAQLLQAMHVDARALPDDAQLAYVDRAGSIRGPLPQSSLGDFIQPGEWYRSRGDTEWQPWPTASATLPIEFDEVGDTSADDQWAGADDEPHDTMLPPLPGSPTAQQQPGSTSPAMDADASTHDDELIDPLEETFTPADPDASTTLAPEAAAAVAPRRSRSGRLVVLLLLVALAVWAYRHWMADTRTAGSPTAPAVIQPPNPARGKPATPARAASAHGYVSATTSSVTAETSAPAPTTTAATSTPAPARTAAAPANALPAGAATTPPAAASAPAPVTTTEAAAAAPAESPGTLPAIAGTVMPARSAPAATTSTAKPATPTH